ncbi:MAG: DNA damage-inducible protein D [Candidatus Cloacimonetes bacterium]|jgi:DNA-damage-inducible protein D|nr:DNA damage-inducible protein D [Candidatus Cloacimonadota bacterium]
MNNLDDYKKAIFERLKKLNEFGSEYWLARDLAAALDYSQWRNFVNVIDKAKEACKNTGNNVLDHFAEVSKMISLPKTATREIDDIMLSRYACYLIVQNADPAKEIVALGQSYFALKTRERELDEEYQQLSEDKKRLAIRQELREHNKQLADAAKDAGIEDATEYAVFQNYGYMGLYGGLKAKDIHIRKGLKKSQKILDHMGSTELAANLFRATQTEEKLRREKVKGKKLANDVHYTVGKKVRETIEELGGTMPEDLPTPEESIAKIEQKNKSITEGKKED